MSSLSSLAEHPPRIMRLVEDQVINKEAVYYVKLSVDGIWRYILLDEFVPVDSDGQPLFAQPRCENQMREIWCMLVEKAWAKIFGNYQVTEAGLPSEVLNSLTGAVCEDVETEDAQFVSLVTDYS